MTIPVDMLGSRTLLHLTVTSLTGLWKASTMLRKCRSINYAPLTSIPAFHCAPVSCVLTRGTSAHRSVPSFIRPCTW